MFTLGIVLGLLSGSLVLEEGRHVSLGHLVGAMDLGPGIVTHCFVHSGLQALATLQDLVELGLSVNSILILVDINHASSTSSKCAGLSTAKVLVPDGLVLKLDLESAVVQASEHGGRIWPSLWATCCGLRVSLGKEVVFNDTAVVTSIPHSFHFFVHLVEWVFEFCGIE